MNLSVARDVLARWTSYEDRGITPNNGWACAPDGKGCALGDIAHYGGITQGGLMAWDMLMADRPGAIRMDTGIFNPWTTDYPYAPRFMAFAAINDTHGRWPIPELRRLIEWAEAETEFDTRTWTVTNNQESLTNV